MLGPGLIACPQCGEGFEAPVPADAFQLQAVPSPKRLFRREAMGLSALLLLTAGAIFGVRSLSHPSPPAAPPPRVAVPSEMAAHPTYAADMTAFIGKLRASGLAAQWPAFGGSDTLLITPPALVGGQKAAWNQTLYQQLAQGAYGGFWERRYESGFSDSDSTTCFVLVCDSSGKIVAADLMGTVQ